MKSKTDRVAEHYLGGPGSRRNGFSLIELSVVIAVSSIIMSTLAISMHRMYRADRDVRDDLAATAALERLTARFRDDAHAAGSISPGGEAEDDLVHSGLIMNLADEQTIEYSYAAGAVQRVQRRGENVIHRDTYRVHRDARVRLRTREEGDVRFAEIVLTGDESTGQQPPVYRIVAAIGLRHQRGVAK